MREIALSDSQVNTLLIDRVIEFPGEFKENEFLTNNRLLTIWKNKKLYLCDVQEGGQFLLRLPKNNIEYIAAINACIDPDIPLIEITAEAGCGKTSLALASALHLYKGGKHEIIFIKENCLSTEFPLGFLKGDLEEKKLPVFQYLDSVINFVNSGSKSKFSPEDIRIETLGYLLGETFDNAIIIVDEAQNLTETNIDLLVTRVGKNSKMFILGDNDQIYNKKSKDFSGLDYLKSVMIGSKMFAHVNLYKCLRSGLAAEFLERKKKYREGNDAVAPNK